MIRTKNLFRNKKAAVLVYITLIGFIFAMIEFYYYSNLEQNEIPSMHIGKRAAEIDVQALIKYKQELASDTLGKYAAWKALFDLGYEGGYARETLKKEISPCGNVKNEPIVFWNTPDKKCFPNKKDLVEAYYSHLSYEINQYFYKEFKNVIPYEYSVIEEGLLTHVVSIAEKPVFVQFLPPDEEALPIKIPLILGLALPVTIPIKLIATAELAALQHFIRSDENSPTVYAGTYNYFPHSHAVLDYSFESMAQISKQAESILNRCSNAEPKKACVDLAVQSLSTDSTQWEAYPWFDHPQNRVFIFKVTENAVNPYFDQKPVMQFALMLSET